MDYCEIMKKRRSVRGFDGRKISEGILNELRKHADNSINPYRIKIDFTILDKDEYGLKNPVITGETAYVTGKVRTVKDAEIAFGFSFEEFLLFAEQFEVKGTIMAGFDGKLFGNAVKTEADEKLACISPLGYAADKMSFRESMMRKAVGADRRFPLEKICYINDLYHPAAEKDISDIGDVVEMVRLAPSAVNKQPWRLVLRDDTVHFYEKRSKGYLGKDGWDIQKIDMGIAICHFYLAAKEKGIKTDYIINDPHISLSEDTEYIGSFKLV